MLFPLVVAPVPQNHTPQTPHWTGRPRPRLSPAQLKSNRRKREAQMPWQCHDNTQAMADPGYREKTTGIPLHQLLLGTRVVSTFHSRARGFTVQSSRVQAALGSAPAFCCLVSFWGCSLSSSRVRSPSWYHRVAVFTPTPKTWVKSYVEEGMDRSGQTLRKTSLRVLPSCLVPQDEDQIQESGLPRPLSQGTKPTYPESSPIRDSIFQPPNHQKASALVRSVPLMHRHSPSLQKTQRVILLYRLAGLLVHWEKASTYCGWDLLCVLFNSKTKEE